MIAKTPDPIALIHPVPVAGIMMPTDVVRARQGVSTRTDELASSQAVGPTATASEGCVSVTSAACGGTSIGIYAPGPNANPIGRIRHSGAGDADLEITSQMAESLDTLN